MPHRKVFCPCHYCQMRVHINQHHQRQHIRLYRLPDNNIEGGSEDNISSTASVDDISSTTSVSQDCSDGEEMEDSNSLPSDIDMDGIDGFDYQAFSQMELPDNYKRNFADLAWKARCNVSDNAYDQMKYTKDEDFWSLKVCRKRLFNISRIDSINIDCCRNSKYPCSKLSISADEIRNAISCLAFTREYKEMNICPSCQLP